MSYPESALEAETTPQYSHFDDSPSDAETNRAVQAALVALKAAQLALEKTTAFIEQNAATISVIENETTHKHFLKSRRFWGSICLFVAAIVSQVAQVYPFPFSDTLFTALTTAGTLIGGVGAWKATAPLTLKDKNIPNLKRSSTRKTKPKK